MWAAGVSRQQVLEEDASVVNPMISSAMRCLSWGGDISRYGKLGELASVDFAYISIIICIFVPNAEP